MLRLFSSRAHIGRTALRQQFAVWKQAPPAPRSWLRSLSTETHAEIKHEEQGHVPNGVQTVFTTLTNTEASGISSGSVAQSENVNAVSAPNATQTPKASSKPTWSKIVQYSPDKEPTKLFVPRPRQKHDKKPSDSTQTIIPASLPTDHSWPPKNKEADRTVNHKPRKVVDPVSAEVGRKLVNERDLYEVEAQMRRVKDEGIVLSPAHLAVGFEKCIQVGSFELAIWVVEHLLSRSTVVPPEYIANLTTQFKSRDHLIEISRVVQKLAEAPTTSNSLRGAYLDILVAKTLANNRNGLKVMDIYDIFLSIRRDKNYDVRLSKESFASLIFRALFERKTEVCLQIFQDMSKLGVDPDRRLCERVLDFAVINYAPDVIRLIGTWFLEVFNVPIEFGTAQRILESAASRGDAPIAILAFQLLTKTNLTPTRADYYSLVRTLIRSGDAISAVEALQDMEARNLSLVPSLAETQASYAPGAKVVVGSTHAFDMHERVKQDFAELFMKPVLTLHNQLESQQAKEREEEFQTALRLHKEATKGGDGGVDSFFVAPKSKVGSRQITEEEEKVLKAAKESVEDLCFALVDQAQKGQSVPRVVLDAVLETLGTFPSRNSGEKKEYVARVMKLFEEYPTVYKLEHNASSYVALAKALHKHGQFEDLLNVFQQADACVSKVSMKDDPEHEFVSKEALSVAYSYLFQYMVDHGIIRGFGDIWRHMESSYGIVPNHNAVMNILERFMSQLSFQQLSSCLSALNYKFREELRTPALDIQPDEAQRNNPFWIGRYPHLPPDYISMLRSKSYDLRMNRTVVPAPQMDEFAVGRLQSKRRFELRYDVSRSARHRPNVPQGADRRQREQTVPAANPRPLTSQTQDTKKKANGKKGKKVVKEGAKEVTKDEPSATGSAAVAPTDSTQNA